MHRLLFSVCAVAVMFYTSALAQTCNPVVTSDRTGLSGTTPGRAWDGNNANYFQSIYNDWQYLQVDFNCTGQSSSLRRYMTKNGSTAGARADQGEAVSYSLDGVNWVNVTVASTTGWQGYTPYSPIAWKRVP